MSDERASRRRSGLLRAFRNAVFRVTRRRIRVFCVGLPKTGTTTLSRMFEPSFRTGHERGIDLLPHVCRFLGGETSEEEMNRRLEERIATLGLEVDSASWLGHFTGFLSQRYDDALFVVTVRDCFSWLESIVTHLSTRRGPRHRLWREYQELRFGSDSPEFAIEEASLREAGLFPVSGFLSYWARANEHLLSTTPDKRRLILRTQDLGESVTELAEFCGVPSRRLRQVHANPSRGGSEVVDRIPDAFVLSKSEEYCVPMMDRLFGEDWRRLAESRKR